MLPRYMESRIRNPFDTLKFTYPTRMVPVHGRSTPRFFLFRCKKNCGVFVLLKFLTSVSFSKFSLNYTEIICSFSTFISSRDYRCPYAKV